MIRGFLIFAVFFLGIMMQSTRSGLADQARETFIVDEALIVDEASMSSLPENIQNLSWEERQAIVGDHSVAVPRQCDLRLPEGFDPQEGFAWDQLCRYGDVNMNEFNGSEYCEGNSLPSADTGEFTLSKQFLDLILLDTAYINARGKKAIVINCAIVPELNLRGQNVPTGVEFRNTIFDRVDLSYARFSGVVRFNKVWVLQSFWSYSSTYENGLTLSSSVVQLNLNLENSIVHGLLSLWRSKVGENLVADQINVSGALQGSGIEVHGNTSFHGVSVGENAVLGNGSTFMGDVSVTRANVTGWLYFGGCDNCDSGTRVFGEFSASQSESYGIQLGRNSSFKKGVDLRNIRALQVVAEHVTIDGELKLRSADIENSISFDFSKIYGESNFDYLVTQTLDARNAIFRSDLKLRGAVVHSLSFSGSHFFSDVDMNSTKVETFAILRDARFDNNVNFAGLDARYLLLGRLCGSNDKYCGLVKWGGQASLDLQQAKIGTLQFDVENGFRRQDGSWLPITWNQVIYEQINALMFNVLRDENVSVYEASKLIEILEETQVSTLSGGKESFRPQPYNALERAFQNIGAEAGAKEIAHARLWHRAETRDSNLSGWLEWIWDMFLWATVGFGVYPAKAGYFFAGLVVLGAFLARTSSSLCEKTGGTKANLGDSLFYSLENAIPLMEPSADYANIEHRSQWVRLFFNFQKVAGFVLATVLIGSLTLGG